MNDKLREDIQKTVGWYGHRSSMQQGRGSTTPGLDFNNAVDEIENLISQEVLDCLDRLSQKSLNFTVPNWQSKDNDSTAKAVYLTHIEAEKLKYTKDKQV